MWRSKAIWAVLILACGQNGYAQDEPCDSLVTQQAWVRFDLVLGRVTAVYLSGGRHQSQQAVGETGNAEEILTVGSEPEPSLRYQRTDDRQQLLVAVTGFDDVEIRRQPVADSDVVPLVFRQRYGTDLKLQIGAGDEARLCAAPSLWHLLLSEPELCETHLLPILRSLRADWPLTAQLDQVEQRMFLQSDSGPGVSRLRIERLINQLGARRFSERQAAHEALRGMGVSVLSHLRDVDPTTLGAEQRRRIADIQQSLTPTTGDTPQRVAAWLQSDTTAWLALMSHAEVDKRELAARRLGEMSLAAVQFDPRAEEAQRRKQLAALKSHLERR